MHQWLTSFFLLQWQILADDEKGHALKMEGNMQANIEVLLTVIDLDLDSYCKTSYAIHI